MAKYPIVTPNMVFGKWTTIERLKIGKSYYWSCKCECGTISNVEEKALKNGSSKSCGCSRYKNVIGQKFGRLLVVEQEFRDNRTWCKCICDCGTEAEVLQTRLLNGNTKSCGCLKIDGITERATTHGMTGTITHRSWKGMKRRCHNPKDQKYVNYGARGITVCDEWKDSFETFLADMGECPEGHSLDRIDVNGNYEPNNCRWTDAATQSRNKTTTRRLEYDGRTQCLTDWAIEFGLNTTTLINRLKSGRSLEDALTKPTIRLVTHEGKTQSLPDWAKELGMSYQTLMNRIKKPNWSIERALTEPVQQHKKAA